MAGKYNFTEFIAASEAEDFDDIKYGDLVWAESVVMSVSEMLKNFSVHAGDCTKQNHSCSLCTYETMLSEFREYTFDEVKYRDKHGIKPIKQ